MFIVGLFSWWYGTGWKGRVSSLRDHLASLMDYFSIDLLLRTLFSPFRQISAGQVRGPISIQLRALADQLISRCIGAMVRSGLIIAGVVAMIVYLVIGAVALIIWPLVPCVPILGAVLAVTGWIPWSS